MFKSYLIVYGTRINTRFPQPPKSQFNPCLYTKISNDFLLRAGWLMDGISVYGAFTRIWQMDKMIASLK